MGKGIMNFTELSRFIQTIGKTYHVPCYDISIYYDHVNVYRGRGTDGGILKRMKSVGRNYYFMQSGTKIIYCVALMRLVQSYQISLKDNVHMYLSDFIEDITIKEWITEYSRANNEENTLYSFSNMKCLVEAVAQCPFEEFIRENIFKPLKMKETSFDLTGKSRRRLAKQYRFDKKSDSFVEYDADAEEIAEKNDGCVVTTVDDYAKFCEALCSGGISQNGYQLLTKESVNLLINELLYKETEKADAYVSIGRHGGLVLIDTKKKITIVYGQNIKNIPLHQLEMYPTLRKLIYECIGADTWSMGYNVLP